MLSITKTIKPSLTNGNTTDATSLETKRSSKISLFHGAKKTKITSPQFSYAAQQALSELITTQAKQIPLNERLRQYCFFQLLAQLGKWIKKIPSSILIHLIAVFDRLLWNLKHRTPNSTDERETPGIHEVQRASPQPSAVHSHNRNLPRNFLDKYPIDFTVTSDQGSERQEAKCFGIVNCDKENSQAFRARQESTHIVLRNFIKQLAAEPNLPDAKQLKTWIEKFDYLGKVRNFALALSNGLYLLSSGNATNLLVTLSEDQSHISHIKALNNARIDASCYDANRTFLVQIVLGNSCISIEEIMEKLGNYHSPINNFDNVLSYIHQHILKPNVPITSSYVTPLKQPFCHFRCLKDLLPTPPIRKASSSTCVSNSDSCESFFSADESIGSESSA